MSDPSPAQVTPELPPPAPGALRASPASRQTSQAYRRPYRPRPVALLNWVGKLLAGAGLQLTSLSEGSLLRAARRKTRLCDFGDDAFRIPLRQLLQALEHEAQLHPLGRLMVRQNLLRILINRLRMEALVSKQPAICEQPLAPPVFIVGLQRTGTTLLQRLLACDPHFRVLSSWESVNPAPWGALPAHGAADPRVKGGRLAQRALTYLGPDFFAIHPVEADAPEEDCLLFDYGFYSTVFEATLRVPSFSAWLEQQDLAPAYAAYARMLQFLLWQRPAARWLLKTPHHMENLDTLLAQFPGARIIWPHRDPVRALASFCSMVAHGQGLFSDEVDPLEIGRHWSTKTGRMVERALKTRERVGEDAFIDVRYEALVGEPLAEVERIYRWLGRELEPEVAQAMARWLGQNPQHKHGRHQYRLKDFGLSAGAEAEKFSAYLERFGMSRS